MVANFRFRRRGDQSDLQDLRSSLKVFELALEMPTADITIAAALDEKACASTWRSAWRRWPPAPTCCALAEMGIGNTTVAATLSRACGRQGGRWSDAALASTYEGLKTQSGAPWPAGGRRCIATISAIRWRFCAGWGPRNRGDRRRHFWPALQRVPVCSTALSLCAARRSCTGLDPPCARSLHGRACVGRKPRMPNVLRRLGKDPILDLGMRLGEGSARRLAVGIVKGALACHLGMATFAEAGVAARRVERASDGRDAAGATSVCVVGPYLAFCRRENRERQDGRTIRVVAAIDGLRVRCSTIGRPTSYKFRRPEMMGLAPPWLLRLRLRRDRRLVKADGVGSSRRPAQRAAGREARGRRLGRIGLSWGRRSSPARAGRSR